MRTAALRVPGALGGCAAVRARHLDCGLRTGAGRLGGANDPDLSAQLRFLTVLLLLIALVPECAALSMAPPAVAEPIVAARRCPAPRGRLLGEASAPAHQGIDDDDTKNTLLNAPQASRRKAGVGRAAWVDRERALISSCQERTPRVGYRARAYCMPVPRPLPSCSNNGHMYNRLAFASSAYSTP